MLMVAWSRLSSIADACQISNLQSTVTTSRIGAAVFALQRGAQRHTAGTGAATGWDGALRRSNI